MVIKKSLIAFDHNPRKFVQSGGSNACAVDTIVDTLGPVIVGVGVGGVRPEVSL